MLANGERAQRGGQREWQLLPVESAHPKVPAPLACGGMQGDTPQGPEESTSLMSGFFCVLLQTWLLVC